MSSSRTSPAASGCCDSGVKDSLGSVQSVLVLGGGSEIALATVRELVARRATTVVLAARRPDALDREVKELRELAGGRPNVTIEAVPFDGDALDTHDAFVDGVFDRFGDFDVVLIAFGVLGEQSRAERDGAAAVEIARVNYLDRGTGPSSCCRPSPASVPAGRTSSTGRRKPASTRSTRASATRSWARERR
jgi:decaprenylphospho-beta-D-erythro-pentofuranosid-2-ulose 2-reductase